MSPILKTIKYSHLKGKTKCQGKTDFGTILDRNTFKINGNDSNVTKIEDAVDPRR